MGKKARYAEIAATPVHGGRLALPPQMTIIGAMAMSGTVYETTIHGVNPGAAG